MRSKVVRATFISFVSMAMIFPLWPGVQMIFGAEVKNITLVLGGRQILPSAAPYTSLAKQYWEQEGLKVDILALGGSTEAIQALVMGKAQFGFLAPPPQMAVMTLERNVSVKAFYCNVVNFIAYTMVLEKSPIRRVADLKGKAIGVMAMSSSAIGYTKALAKEAGLDPNKDISFFPIGMGAQAATALTSKKVDAIAIFDGAYASIEQLGIKLRRLESLPLENKLGAAVNFVAMEDYLKKHRNEAIGLGRGIAKGTLFAITNPVATIKIHWKAFPESKPTGIDEKTAFAREEAVLQARLKNVRVDSKPVPLWGAILFEEMAANQEAFFLAGDLKSKRDPWDYFTMELLAEINNFDSRAIINEARDWKEK